MKKIYAMAAAIAAVGACSGAAHAQSNVTIYGLVDAAVEHYNNANPAGDGLTRLPSLAGGMFPSRFGLRGSEDLGNGLSAIFTLENGLQPDTGNVNQGGRLFGRQAWVGLAGSWGALTIGRTYSMLYISTFDVDPYGPTTYGIGSLDPFIPNARHDNSVSYKGTFDRITVGATYSLGRDVSTAGGPSATGCAGESATSVQACREYSGLLRYDAPESKYGALVAYDHLRGGAGAANGLVSADLSDSRLHVAGFLNIGAWKFGGGVLHRNNEGSKTPTSNLSYFDAGYAVTPQLFIDGQISRLDFKDSPNDSAQVLLRAMYNFSKRTTVYVAAGHITNDGSAAVALSSGGTVGAGLSQTGVITGIKHSF
jgi:predicted porin